jgi:hypothetical protein
MTETLRAPDCMSQQILMFRSDVTVLVTKPIPNQPLVTT